MTKFRNRETGVCHICGEVRPVENLGTEQHKAVIPGSNQRVMEVVMYCNDKAECTSAAPKYSFTNLRKPVTATRATRPVGE